MGRVRKLSKFQDKEEILSKVSQIKIYGRVTKLRKKKEIRKDKGMYDIKGKIMTFEEKQE